MIKIKNINLFDVQILFSNQTILLDITVNKHLL